MKSIREALTKSTETVSDQVEDQNPAEKKQEELRIQVSQGLPKLNPKPNPKTDNAKAKIDPVLVPSLPKEKSVPKSNKFLNAVKSMLTDSQDDNAISSKRVVAFLAFIFCSIAFFANLFFNFEIAQFMYESMIWIVVGGLGFTALEKFAPNSKDD
jgi:hypothetical protein